MAATYKSLIDRGLGRWVAALIDAPNALSATEGEGLGLTLDPAGVSLPSSLCGRNLTASDCFDPHYY